MLQGHCFVTVAWASDISTTLSSRGCHEKQPASLSDSEGQLRARLNRQHSRHFVKIEQYSDSCGSNSQQGSLRPSIGPMDVRSRIPNALYRYVLVVIDAIMNGRREDLSDREVEPRLTGRMRSRYIPCTYNTSEPICISTELRSMLSHEELQVGRGRISVPRPLKLPLGLVPQKKAWATLDKIHTAQYIFQEITSIQHRNHGTSSILRRW